jgi:trehalose 6-phosphate synthase/phosphatase
LNKIKREQKKQHVKLLDKNIVTTLKLDYDKAQKRLILLDYDGTLAPITKLPSEASPTKQLLDLLKALAEDEKNEVFIISGRDANTLEKWLGHLQLNFIAEHGAFIKYKNEEWQPQSSVPGTWKEEIRPMLQSYVFRCAGSFLEEKNYALSWHYRNTHPGLGFTRSRELLNNLLQLTTNSPVQIIDGNKVLEVRLTGMDKGITALKVLEKTEPDFILCMGDDTTDEDMFKALADRAYTIKIGTGSTVAKYNIPDQADVFGFLNNLV